MGELRPTAEIEELARRLAEIEGRDVNEAVAAALRAALAAKTRSAPDPLEMAEKLRRKFGIELSASSRRPVPQSVYDELGPKV